MPNVLENFAEHLAPLHKTVTTPVTGSYTTHPRPQPYNEFWGVYYHNLDPAGSYISAEGGGVILDPDGLRFDTATFPAKSTGNHYIPFLTITTEETNGYDFMELTRKGAQKFFEEERSLYEYLNILIRQLQDKDPAPYLPSFGVTPETGKRRCWSIGEELGVGQHKGLQLNPAEQSSSLVLCFGTGADPYYDHVLESIVSINEPDDWGHVWDFICSECSPKLTDNAGQDDCWLPPKKEDK